MPTVIPPTLAAQPPPIELTWPTWAVWIVAIGGVCVALLAIATLVVRTGRGMRTVGVWLGDIVTDRVTTIVAEHTLDRAEVTEIVDSKVAPLHAELTANGGASLKDQVTRIDRLLTEHIAESAEDRTQLRRYAQDLESRMMFPDERTP